MIEERTDTIAGIRVHWYLPTRFAQRYADALGGPTEVELLERAGHWPWLDRPEVVGRVEEFLAGRH